MSLRIETAFFGKQSSSCNKLFNIVIIKMPVDKWGRNGDRTTPVYTGINIANLTNSFLRGDVGNTAIGAIDMNSHIIKMWRIRCQITMLQPRIM